MTDLHAHPHIAAILRETGEDDPYIAIRAKARALVAEYHGTIGEVPPFNMDAFASLRGLARSADAPKHSDDSEIAPEADGRVVLRVNRDRPRSRQRFSIGHEIGHTLFPDFHHTGHCRKGKDRNWANSDDLIESLCDVAASELLFPHPWFHDRIRDMTISAAALATLATDYQASRDATVRRFVEISADPIAAVFFSWKLKPTEEKQLLRDRRQKSMFDRNLVAEAEANRKLRVDYAILSETFEDRCISHIPRDKSIPSEGPIHDASIHQVCTDGQLPLDLGSIRGTFTAHTLPIYTPEDTVGPTGGCSVVVVIRPVPVRNPR